MVNRILRSMVILVAAMGSVTAVAADGSLRLVLNVSQPAVNLDDCVHFTLTLEGRAVGDAIASWPAPGVVVSLSEVGARGVGSAPPPSMSTEVYRFEPADEGVATLGPFTLRVGDEVLRSNSVDVIVAPAPTSDENVRIIPQVDSAHVGEPFRITVVAFFGTSLFDVPDWPDPTISHPLIGEVAPTVHSIDRFGHLCVEGFSCKHMLVFEATPTQAGELALGEENLATLPGGAAVQRVVIEVRD